MTRGRILTGVLSVLLALCIQARAAGLEDAVQEPGEASEQNAFQDLYEHPDKGKEAFIILHDVFSLSVNPRIQVQSAFYVGDDSLRENNDVATTEGFLIRRARLGLYGSMKESLGVNLVLDLKDGLEEGAGNTIYAANIVYRPFEFLNFALGTAPIFFCGGSMVSSAKLQLIERPLSVQQLSAENQLGFAVLGKALDGLLVYGAGIYNGGPGFTYGDVGKGFLYAGRIQVAPLGQMDPGESDLSGSPFRLVVGADYYFNHDSSTTTHAFSADLAIKWRGLSFRAEWIYDTREPEQRPVLPPGITDKTDRRGWYVQAGYFVLPALLEVAGRFEQFDDNIFIADTGDLWLGTFGLNLFLMDGYLKLQLNYIHKEEREVPEMSNDAVFVQVQVNL